MWENSAAALAAAHAAGAEYVETDCQVTADGDVVLFHDSTLERLAGDPRSIGDVSTRELTALFADHGGLLTVRDALDLFPTSRFNIDVKTTSAAEALGALLVDDTHRVLVASFSDANRRLAISAALRAGAALRPATSAGVRTVAALRMLTALGLSSARALRDVDALQIPAKQGAVRVLTRALLASAHRYDTEVHIWTINDPDEMIRLVELGVDGIISDRADLALSTFRP